jgi:cytochrome P450
MTDLRATALAFDLKRLDAAFLDDPFPVYRALREHDPVHRMPDGSYFLSRYDDCAAVYRDPETWSSDKTVDFRPNLGDSLLYEHHTTSLVFNDPPYHTRVRKLLAHAFTPRSLMALQPRIEALVDRLLDRTAARGGMDLIADFAAAVPIQLVGDMLGMPEAERGLLRGWSLAILGALEPVLTPEQVERGNRAVDEFKTYLRDLIERRGRAPSRDEGEILSKLTAGSALGPGERSDERLSELELLHNCIFILNAGHETTTNLIGNGVDLLLRHSGALRALRADPGLIGAAVEEFLRLESSNQLGNRRAARDTVLGGVPMPAGTYVHIGIAAANRDPAQFPDPDRLDIRRQPNRHLAFGTGIHACAGMWLARMEGQVAIGRLVQRFATIERAGTFRRRARSLPRLRQLPSSRASVNRKDLPRRAQHRAPSRCTRQSPSVRTAACQRAAPARLPGSPEDCLRTAVCTMTRRLFGST